MQAVIYQWMLEKHLILCSGPWSVLHCWMFGALKANLPPPLPTKASPSIPNTGQMAGKFTLFKSSNSGSFLPTNPHPHMQPPTPTPWLPRLHHSSAFLSLLWMPASGSNGHVRMTQWRYAPARGRKGWNETKSLQINTKFILRCFFQPKEV